MTTLKLALVCSSIVALTTNCGLSDKAAELQDNAAALQAEYEGFNLSCSFEDISSESEAEDDASKDDGAALDDATATDEATDEESTCEDADQQYAVMVDKFDTDGDGELSEDELAEARAGYEDAQKQEMDADGDDKVSDTEKKSWKDTKLADRKDKMQERFNEACEKIGKPTDECKGMRGVKKGLIKQAIDKRLAEFDTDKDGKLSKEEADKMRETLQGEREKKRDDFKKAHDTDGDGKLSPDEHAADKQARDDKKAAHPGPGQPGGPQQPGGMQPH